MRKMHRLAVCLGAGLAAGTVALAATDQQENIDRLNTSAEVFQEIMSAPDKGIPQELLEKAQCVVIVPGVKKGAFLVGAEYGKGYFVCRERGGRVGPRRARSSSRAAVSAFRSAGRRPTS